jgi:hypothetical protein
VRWGQNLTTDRPRGCPDPDRCKRRAEGEARSAVGDHTAQLIAYLDQLKPVAEVLRRAPRTRWSEARISPAAWALLRDLATKDVALRDGATERAAWRATYANSTRSRRQRALNNLRRAGDARHRTRSERLLISAIASRVKQLRGRWPSYSGASGYGGKDVLRIRDWLNYVSCPYHLAREVSSDVIMRCLKELRSGRSGSARDVSYGRFRMWAADQLMAMAEEDFVAIERETGEPSEMLQAIRAARNEVAPFVRQLPPSRAAATASGQTGTAKAGRPRRSPR